MLKLGLLEDTGERPEGAASRIPVKYRFNKAKYDELKNRTNANYDLMVFEYNPLLLLEDVKISDSRIVMDLTFSGKKKLWEKMCQSNTADFTLFYEYFVTCGMDDLLTYPITEPIYATRYYKGAKTGIIESPGKEYLENEQYDISDLEVVVVQENALREFIEQVRADGQNFIFLESPHYSRLEEDETYKRCDAYFKSILEEYQVECIDTENVNFDTKNPAYFEDLSHLSTKGREEFTKNFISLIQK